LHRICASKEQTTNLTMSEKIEHDGIIEHIDGSHIRVRISQTSACSACKVANRCNASESKEKIVDVYGNPNGLRKGQSVKVCTSKGTARKAIAIGFILPLAIIMVTMLMTKLYGLEDAKSALVALGALIPYYIVIWLLRQRIARGVSFYIE